MLKKKLFSIVFFIDKMTILDKNLLKRITVLISTIRLSVVETTCKILSLKLIFSCTRICPAYLQEVLGTKNSLWIHNLCRCL